MSVRSDQLEKAQLVLLQSLAIKRNLYSDNDSETATTLELLAHTYLKKGRNKTDQQLVFNISVISTLTVFMIHETGEMDKAEEEYNKVLQIKEKVYGKDHWEVARTHNDRCQVLFAKGHVEAALPVCHELLRVRETLSLSLSLELRTVALGIILLC